MSAVVVKNIKIIDISPKLKGVAGSLLPKELLPEQCSFEVYGVNTGIANGIRRAILSEVKVKSFDMDIDTFETNDPFVKLEQFVRERIRCIPIRQTVDPNLELKLDFQNNTKDQKSALSSDLIITKKVGDTKNLFNSTIELVSIAPEKFIKIGKIFVTEGYSHEFGGYTAAYGVLCVPLDEQPYNMYTGEGISSSVSKSRDHKIQFETNGTIPPKKLVVMACDEIINRLERLDGLIYQLKQIDDTHQLIVRGENDTIGNIISRTVHELHPEVECVCPIDSINRSMKITIRADEPNNVLSEAIRLATDTLKKIKKSFL